MASRTVTVYTDDLTGEESEKVTPVTFSLNGASYSIDLSPESVEKLTRAISPFTEKARRTGGSARRTSAGSRNNTTAIREWARANGYKVGDRGRIHEDVQAAYRAAH